MPQLNSFRTLVSATTCDQRVRCARCDDPVDADVTVRTVAGSVICPACRDVFYWCCPECGGWNRDGNSCANDCPDNEDDDYGEDEEPNDACGGLVHDYGFKPSPVFHGAGLMHLGLELEIATPDGRGRDCAETAVAWLGALGYLKADDSIGGGFEIVTHPMTHPWAMAHFPWQMLPTLEAAGCEATTRTGMHVHLSRAGFDGPCHTYRWMKFIHRNQPQVTALARRDDSQWARFHDEDRRAVKDYAKGQLGMYRYRAINTLNPDTFELRVFASTLDPALVQAALGFAAASVEYTRHLTVPAIVHHDAWAWPAFTDWITGQPSYAALLEQCQGLTAEVAACAC